MTDDQPGDDLEPAVWAHLEASLDTYQREHERAFLPPSSADEVQLHEAMQLLQRHAFTLLTTGQTPGQLEAELQSFQPGAPINNKVLDLLRYNVVQHRLEFDVAWDVVGRLHKVSDRLQAGIIAYAFLLRSKPSETAIKFFKKAAVLFLAGYDSEVSIMCGAVLEAALRTRVPDSLLAAKGVKPQFKRAQDYSVQQRMRYVEKEALLTEDLRKSFWDVMNWRNDAVHVQPDLAPPPAQAVLFTANLLGSLLPRSLPL